MRKCRYFWGVGFYELQAFKAQRCKSVQLSGFWRGWAQDGTNLIEYGFDMTQSTQCFNRKNGFKTAKLLLFSGFRALREERKGLKVRNCPYFWGVGFYELQASKAQRCKSMQLSGFLAGLGSR